MDNPPYAHTHLHTLLPSETGSVKTTFSALNPAVVLGEITGKRSFRSTMEFVGLFYSGSNVQLTERS